eukprot:CAMPEP_0117647970 /NCGR_PEP_ID=MMETSP0804-20121206/133_1 /TAXON_ID=1074897 /ORGANISM="Tetraselmis astigmatica, Strain CCMP880" /LENGTH=147 /DNA_ID=CAMNT_0005453497 /DNA_START=1497 /DNA_END=1938 /DNA_ORIENTATION=-
MKRLDSQLGGSIYERHSTDRGASNGVLACEMAEPLLRPVEAAVAEGGMQAADVPLAAAAGVAVRDGPPALPPGLEEASYHDPETAVSLAIGRTCMETDIGAGRAPRVLKRPLGLSEDSGCSSIVMAAIRQASVDVRYALRHFLLAEG